MSTYAGYLSFIRDYAGIPSSIIPDNSIYIASSYAMSVEIVSEYLAQVSDLINNEATYNLATHILIETAQDLPGAQFTGYIQGNNLTVVSVISGTIATQQTLTSTGLQPNTLIIGGSSLSWTVNPAQTFGSVGSPILITSAFTYFSALRASWQINQFVPGVVASIGDEGTNTSFKNPAIMEGLKFSDLSYIKSPFGRKYLAIADRVGSPFGMS